MRFFEIHRELYGVLPFVLTSIGRDKQAAIHRPTGFDSHHFLWVVKGCGHFCMDGESFTLRCGEGFFMRDDLPHSYESADGNDFETAYLTFTMGTDALDYLGATAWFRFIFPTFLEKDFEHLLQFSLGNSTVLSRSSAGYALVTELFAATLSAQDTPDLKIERFLESHYGEPLSLDDIASSVGMDRFSLCRYYAKAHQSTVMDALLHIRIEKAKRFLRYSSDPIRQITTLCGFESPSYFGKRFRQSVGCTPTEYRKRYSESVL